MTDANETLYPPIPAQEGKDLEMVNSDDVEEGSVEAQERGNWTGKCDFFMSCLSYAVGLGNLWRFPYLCYKNGGGAFLIPYCLMMVFAGMPLFFMELSFGQFAATGVINIWSINPLFKGIGYAMFTVSFMVGIYYTMVIAWAFYFTFASFAKDVPWKTCDNEWNTIACSQPEQFRNCSSYNGTWFNSTCWTALKDGEDVYQEYTLKANATGRRSASYEYFHNRVLAISDNIDEMGYPQWEHVLCLLLSWSIVFLCLIKGIKSSGKAVYFTALFPYVVLIILLGKAATLDGAINGIKFYVTPKWERLGTAAVWGDAAVQIFFSLSPCWGGLITLASYNKFDNNALRDSVVVTLSNCGTSFFAGFVIFAIIGFMAEQLNMDIEDAAVGGAGLAFVAYPEVVAQLPISPLWSILFFLMLITLGLGTQMTTVNTVHTTILDLFSDKFRKGHRPKIVLACVCFISFLLGLTMTCNGGMYMLQLMDTYAATYSVLVIGLCECVAIAWIYGWQRFGDDIKLMLGRSPALWWRVMWQGVTPLLMFFILIFTFVDFEPTKYDGKVLKTWADVLGWCLSLFCMSPILVVAVYTFVITKRANPEASIRQCLKIATTPTPEWGPSNSKAAQGYPYTVPMVIMNSQQPPGQPAEVGLLNSSH
ncbi:sodium- and chloride-dependent glycine transporter 1-like [Watersipora subatra]|uniref:sodium- and chloride-dependent glycine transporter 1-like n=1 Tax=Watersipora subatra TaxID=2589382 RepID=UPI00355B9ABA